MKSERYFFFNKAHSYISTPTMREALEASGYLLLIKCGGSSSPTGIKASGSSPFPLPSIPVYRDCISLAVKEG